MVWNKSSINKDKLIITFCFDKAGFLQVRQEYMRRRLIYYGGLIPLWIIVQIKNKKFEFYHINNREPATIEE